MSDGISNILLKTRDAYGVGMSVVGTSQPGGPNKMARTMQDGLTMVQY